jgi:hypothetical protein
MLKLWNKKYNALCKAKQFLCLALLLCAFKVNAQQVVDFSIDTALKKYTFIKPDSASFFNDSIALASFYEKLYKLHTSMEGNVSVLHIGDSHIQADHFSGVMRQHLQLDFGNAGRGFIFPYKLAKSNEPSSYKTQSNVTWEYKRCVFVDKPMPIGIGGYTIQSNDTASAIILDVKNQDKLDYGFTKLVLFHAKTNSNFDLTVSDTAGKNIGYVNVLTKAETPYTSVLNFASPQNKIIIKACPRDSNQKSTQLYGMYAENGKPGIIYNMIGVNGAEYWHYNSAAYFHEQVKFLKPDLVIISLGTNEGFNYKAFNKQKFYAHIDSMVKAIKKNNPQACILLTTPGDSFKRAGRKGRVKNPTIIEVRNTIIEYAQKNNLAWWDWFTACGGFGAMAKWKAAGMADAYRVHYSKKGYEIQGELMYRAMMEGYSKYVKNNLK